MKQGEIRHRCASFIAAVIIGGALWGATAAAAKPAGNHCISPAGDDLHQVLGPRNAFIAPFCTQAVTGDKWRAVLRVAVAGDDYVFPVGYEPSQPLLDEDFLAKFVSARYVVDAGTRQERTYVFRA